MRKEKNKRTLILLLGIFLGILTIKFGGRFEYAKTIQISLFVAFSAGLLIGLSIEDLF